MVETVRYGSWNAYGDPARDTVEATVLARIRTRDTAWVTRTEQTGAFTQIAADYRRAINDALPKNVRLEGDTFHGPANAADYTWTLGDFSIIYAVKTVDLDAIITANDPDR